MGDNLSVMRLLSAASVDLIYADPPFFSGRQYQAGRRGRGERGRGEGTEKCKMEDDLAGALPEHPPAFILDP